jgi:CRISPR-associated protein Cmr2
MDIDKRTIAEQMKTAIAHCLAWQSSLSIDDVIQALDAAAEILQNPLDTLKDSSQLAAFAQQHDLLWTHKIGLVYGGATKIKQYVFESADLQEIRGASALLDRINLIDLPAFFKAETETEGDRFHECRNAANYCRQIRSGWLHHHFPSLESALLPEMVVYSTGGNILALCPAELVDDLANAIEKRYTTETLTANACVVGDTFRPLEIYLGLLNDPADSTLWLDTIETHKANPAAQAYFGFEADADTSTIKQAWRDRKGFSELVGKLANQFNQRRSGYDTLDRTTSRRYPPMFETHPYLMRDDSDRRSLVLELTPTRVLEMNPEQTDEKLKVDEILPDNPKFSEPSARKRWIGQVTKRETSRQRAWYRKTDLLHHWNPIQVLDDERPEGSQKGLNEAEDLFRVGLSSWVNRFEQYLHHTGQIDIYEDEGDRHIFKPRQDQNRRAEVQDYYTREARSLTEIGAASNGFVGYIYADGNNMGQHIREHIQTPEDYQRFSEDIFKATEQSVYWALAKHLEPFYYTPDAKSSRDNKNPVWIHPFEIITIGGDDVLIVVPANKALEIAHTIGEKFEEILVNTGRYPLEFEGSKNSTACHRYKPLDAPQSKCSLSISSGVLIAAENTPIYYADKLIRQLLKSAKNQTKDLKKKGYFGGTVDFLMLKAVTMISSNIESFRKEGLTVRFPERQQELKLYAAPYTLHELKGLIGTVRAVKEAGFPRSQLYQIRSLLEQGKRTAILNYRYFRIRLGNNEQRLLESHFEAAWCEAETNRGNLAPWSTAIRKKDKTTYETLWRELVELYDFIEVSEAPTGASQAAAESTQGGEVSA